jgi:hypothetical protein
VLSFIAEGQSATLGGQRGGYGLESLAVLESVAPAAWQSKTTQAVL